MAQSAVVRRHSLCAASMTTRIVRNQVVVKGGGLKENDVWNITYIEVVQGVEFIRISLADRLFRQYLGLDIVNESTEGFFRDLQERRNVAVDQLMLELMQKNPVDTKRRKIDLHDDIPKIVTINVPPINDYPQVTTLNVLASPRKTMKLAVEFTEDALAYLRAGAWSYEAPESPTQLKLCEQCMLPGCPNVAWNKQRQCWMVKVLDADARERHKCFTPKHSDLEDLSEQYSQEAAIEAQDFWDKHNGRAAGGVSPVEGS